MSDSFIEHRCKYCNKLFFKGDLKYCTIEIKCRKCKNLNEIKGLNCKLLLLSDQQSFYKRDNEISKAAVQYVNQCVGCEESNNCEYYKAIMSEKVSVI